MASPPRVLAERVMKGDRRAVAKAITLVENREEGAREFLRFLKGGRAFVLGITGAPGTGKSTLVDRLVEHYRKEGLGVGVIAVDPTSPITGGALLGDRLRMLRHANDEGVFIRSMASRGWAGGLSAAVSDAIRVLDASGKDLILVETVGIGQADVEIMKVTHAVAVVVIPSMGDEIQVSKAGLMEIADVYVVNKGDLEGADMAALEILRMIRESRWKKRPPVVKVSALKNEGMEELAKAIDQLREKIDEDGEGREMRVRSTRGMLVETAKSILLASVERRMEAESSDLAEEILSGRMNFEDAVKRLSRAA